MPAISATARPRRSSDSSFAAGRGSASASAAMRVRVAAPMAAAMARRQALRVPVVALGADAHEQHAFGADAFEIGEEPGFAGLGGEVAALDEPRELFPAAQVEGFGFGGEFAVVMDADGDTIDGQLGERLRPDFELHVITLALSRRAAVF